MRLGNIQVLPNWYVAAEGQNAIPRIIKSTADESLSFVARFDTIDKSVRAEEDMYRPYMPEQRFKRNRVRKQEVANQILPTPLGVKPLVQRSSLVLASNSWSVVYSPKLLNEANYVKGTVAAAVAFPHSVFVCIFDCSLLQYLHLEP